MWDNVANKNWKDMIRLCAALKKRIDDLAKERDEVEEKLKVLRGDGEGCE